MGRCQQLKVCNSTATKPTNAYGPREALRRCPSCFVTQNCATFPRNPRGCIQVQWALSAVGQAAQDFLQDGLHGLYPRSHEPPSPTENAVDGRDFLTHIPFCSTRSAGHFMSCRTSINNRRTVGLISPEDLWKELHTFILNNYPPPSRQTPADIKAIMRL